MVNKVIDHSSYLDLTAYRFAAFDDSSTVQEVYGLAPASVSVATVAQINVAIVLERANSADSLLAEDWATRQAAIADQDEIWSTYGADTANYDKVRADIAANPNLTILDGSNSNYVTSQEARTIWVQLDAASDFNDLFSSTLMQYTDSADANNDFVFWNDDLSLPEDWNIAGLWFDFENRPDGALIAPVKATDLAQGPQSVGNGTAGAPPFNSAPALAPQDIADLYNFPLDGETVSTGTIGLIEPGVGSYLKDDPTGSQFQERLTRYVTDMGRSGTGTVVVQGANGQTNTETLAERSLDVGVAAQSTPTATSFCTPAPAGIPGRAVPTTLRPRSSRPSRARSGTPPTTRPSPRVPSSTS